MISSVFGSIDRLRGAESIGPGRARVLGPLVLLLLSLVMSSSASEPEIVRVRVPAKDVSQWFPAGTELRVMPAEQFDALVRRAVKGASLQRAAQPPRLIRARHQARWDSGVLSGRSELVIEASSSGPADFALDPWTPAILPAAQSAKVLGARDSGKPSLWIDQVPNQTIVLEWELRPRLHSRGGSFVLATSRRGDDGPDIGNAEGLGAYKSSREAASSTGVDRPDAKPVGDRSRVRSNRAAPVQPRSRRVAGRDGPMAVRLDPNRPAQDDEARWGVGQLDDGLAGGIRRS